MAPKELPHRVRINYQHKDWYHIEQWLVENAGSKYEDWQPIVSLIVLPYGGSATIFFKNKNTASEFKLRFG